MDSQLEQTKRQIRGFMEICLAVADAIKALGPVPSGHLYAQLMGHMDLTTYQRIIDTLVNAEVVRRDPSHLLTWVGPK